MDVRSIIHDFSRAWLWWEGENNSLPSEEKASEQVRLALTKRHGENKKGNTVLHGAWHKSKDYYGHKWEPVHLVNFTLFTNGISINKRQLP